MKVQQLFEFASVYCMLGLTHAALNCVRLHNLDVGRNSYYALHAGCDALFQCRKLGDAVGVVFGLHLYLDIECIGVVHAIDHRKFQ